MSTDVAADNGSVPKRRTAEDWVSLGESVLIREIPDNLTEGGVVIPEGANPNDVIVGEVVNVGPGVYSWMGERIPTFVKKGDVVFMAIAGGQRSPIQIGGETLILCKESNIAGRMRRPNEAEQGEPTT